MKKISYLIISFLLFPLVIYAEGTGKLVVELQDALYVNGQNSSDSVYFLDNNKLYQYNILLEQNNLIHTFSNEVVSSYIKNNVIYIETNDYDNPTFIGYNLVNFEEVYHHSFPISKKTERNFLIDNEENIYLTDNNNIYIYNKKDVLIDSLENISYRNSAVSNLSLKGLNPKENILFVGLGYYSGGGYFALNNHQFLQDEFAYYNSSYDLQEYSFLNDSLAINSYGEIVSFNTDDLNNIKKTEYTHTNHLNRNYPNYFINDNDTIIINDNIEQKIYEYDKTTYRKLYRWENIPNITKLVKLVKNDEKISILYYQGIELYVTSIKITDKIGPKRTTITNHKTLSYTKEDVQKAYLDTYNRESPSDGYYEEKPNFNSSSYYEGTLKEEVQNNVLKEFNYFRYLAGLNQVSLATYGMNKCQKGAFVLSVNKELTHYPSRKPTGMSDEFFNDAKVALASGNAIQGYTPYGMLLAWMNDNKNASGKNVGHRLYMIDKYTIGISFGYVDGYGSLNIANNTTKNDNNDEFYPWPPAGYMPIESILGSKDVMWSILINNSSFSSETYITFDYNNETFTLTHDKISYSAVYDAMYFYLPDDLFAKLNNGSNSYKKDSTVTVYVHNLKEENEDMDYIDIKYNTNFFQAKINYLKDLDVLVSLDSKTFDPESKALEVGKKYQLNYTYDSNVTIGNIDVSVKDDSVISYNALTKELTPLKGGSTELIIKESLSGFTKNVKISVIVPSTNVKLNKESLYLSVGKTETLIASLLPEGTTDQPNFTWTSTNTNVAEVQDGVVKAKSKGATDITVKTDKGYTAICKVTVGDFLKGDLNENGKIEVIDAVEALYYALGKRELTSHKIEIGDFNNDQKITAIDAVDILRLYMK